MNVWAGIPTFKAGTWMINCIPLIIPHTWAKLPLIIIFTIRLPAAAEAVAALEAVEIAWIEFVAFPSYTYLEQGCLIDSLSLNDSSN